MGKKGYNLIQVIIIIIITSIISGITIGIILLKSNIVTSNSPYSELLEDANIQSFLKTYDELTSEYYEDIDKKALINNAIDGMTNYLNEAYTSLLNENSANDFYSQLSGNYTGVGIITINNIITDVIESSPASKAGIKKGDLLVKVNNQDVIGKSNTEISTQIIRSSPSVNLTIIRDQKEIKYDLKTELVNYPNISYEIDKDNIAYLRINVFSKNISYQVKNVLDNFKNKNINQLIIDIRDNAGGYLDQTKKIASYFTKKNNIIYSLDNNGKVTKYKDEDDLYYEFKIIILVNNNTASAAEVFASALKDNNYAKIVGIKTYGKGKVQHTYSLDSGSLLKYTSSKWLTPKGICIDQIGITPDYIIENKQTLAKDGISIIGIEDTQKSYAKELLNVK